MPRLNHCAICGEHYKGHLHRVQKDWLEELSRISGKSLTQWDRVCDNHFEQINRQRFTKAHPPKLKREFATPYHLTPTKRGMGSQKRPHEASGSPQVEEVDSR